jgi:peptidoglycan/LPS O-acetylase OafA/YrhL
MLKINKSIGVIFVILFFLIAIMIWSTGDREEAISVAGWGVLVFIFFVFVQNKNPEKTQRNKQILGIVVSIMAFFVASLDWVWGRYNNAKLLIVLGVIVIIISVIIPKTNFYKKYLAFMQKKNEEIKAKRNKI